MYSFLLRKVLIRVACTSLVPVLGFRMILTDKLMTTRGGGGGCSAATEMLFIDWTIASHLHQLIDC